ncbi:MAG: UPF0149 family protein [Chromatiaceae bacterium]|nr:UPF0149 family protein [Chromatiaceae bacterium]MCF7995821.1 UPF0149 family protein [Chromatiaceae bacterium]
MAFAVAPDYDRLSRLLAGVELAPSPAEAQGMLCGLLALHLPDPLERWQAQLLLATPAAESNSSSEWGLEPAIEAAAAPAPIDLTFQGRKTSAAGHAEAHACCDDPSHDHAGAHAGYPADVNTDADADERSAALEQLAAWTQSAIGPTSLSFDLLLPPEDRPLQERAHAVLDWVRGLLFGLALGGLDREQLLGQAAEAFDDLVELTRIDLDAIVEGDADEQALTEIVEFLRVAAMLIREDRAKALLDERDRQVAEMGMH